MIITEATAEQCVSIDTTKKDHLKLSGCGAQSSFRLSQDGELIIVLFVNMSFFTSVVEKVQKHVKTSEVNVPTFRRLHDDAIVKE